MSFTVIDSLLEACVDYRDIDDQPSARLLETARAWFKAAETEPELVRATAAALKKVSPVGASFVATLVGNVVEVDGGAERSFDELWALFIAWCMECNAAKPGDESRQLMLAQALTGIGPALVSHLAQLPDRRAALRGDLAVAGLLEELSGGIAGVCWVFKSLQMTSGSLIVLHPTSASGWRLRYENVSLCFHLFTLLQCELGDRVPGGRIPNPALAAAANGVGPADGLHDQAWWHYGHALATTCDVRGSIWGEAPAAEIPTVRGEQVILLWPPILAGRSWEASFFTPHLQQMPARVILEGTLSPEQCKEWIEHLALDVSSVTRQRSPALAQVRPRTPAVRPVIERPWWKFWA